MNNKKTIILWMIILPVILVFLFNAFDYIILLWGNELINRILNACWAAFAIGTAAYEIYSYIRLLSWDEKKDEFDKDTFISKLKNEVADGQNPRDDIIGLMVGNIAEIREYFEISKAQAKKSFNFAIIAAFLGLGFFIIAIIIGLNTKDVQPAVISAIGGATVEIVSIFTLNIYKKAQEQLQYYYNSLHDNEKYLSTIHLIGKLSDDKQDAAYLDLIMSGLTNSAQQIETPEK